MNAAMDMPGVVITGLGIVSAIGNRVSEHRESLHAPVVNCGKVPASILDTELDYPLFHVSKNLVDELVLSVNPAFELCFFYGISRTMDLFLFAAIHALNDAGISPGRLKDKRVGMAVGTTVGCTFNNEAYYNAWRKGRKGLPCPVLSYVSANLASSMHDFLGTSGPSAVITNACASGTDAIGLASDWIRSGLCDIAIAGGADELSRIALNGFSSLMLTSDMPCQPFDRNRKGLNLGEGAGVMVLEPDGCFSGKRKGFVRGYGTASDAWHPTAPHPEGRGLVAAFNAAIDDANIEAMSEISFINMHGTGTFANDSAEMSAMSQLGMDALDVPMVSTKGMTGHTLGAAGGIEAVLTLLALESGSVTGTVGCVEPDSSLACLPLPEGETVELRGRTGVSQSLAFGGGNSVLVLESAA